MRFRYLLVFVCVIFFTACSHAVPKSKLAYVGEWKSKNMYLLILRDGRVSYKKIHGTDYVTLKGPLKKFVGDNFVVGVAFLTTTFKVSQAPKQINGVWKMTVNGVQLTRQK